MKMRPLLLIFFAINLLGQDIFLKCENLWLSHSNTKWIDGECVRVEPKEFVYFSIDVKDSTFEHYGWSITTSTPGKNHVRKNGRIQACGHVWLRGQELIDYEIKTNHDFFLLNNIFYSRKGEAQIYPTKIELENKEIDRVSGLLKNYDSSIVTSHQCNPINKDDYDLIIDKMKSDNAKLKAALQIHFKKERKF